MRFDLSTIIPYIRINHYPILRKTPIIRRYVAIGTFQFPKRHERILKLSIYSLLKELKSTGVPLSFYLSSWTQLNSELPAGLIYS